MPEPMASGREAVATTLLEIDREGVRHREDQLAAEEPMEVRVVAQDGGRPARHSIAVTMRTPGDDRALAVGFLLGEGIVRDHAAIESVELGVREGDDAQSNVTTVFLTPGTAFDAERFRRNVYTSSSCGICGRASIERVEVACAGPPEGTAGFAVETVLRMSDALRDAQTVFARTGGLHAAALFEPDGTLRLLREDVGRHNAVDKLTGTSLLDDRLPASNTALLVSGRASYELVQKALMAGIPTLVAIGAPSSLAVELAKRFGMTLIGFLRGGRFNIYCGPQRIR